MIDLWGMIGQPKFRNRHYCSSKFYKSLKRMVTRTVLSGYSERVGIAAMIPYVAKIASLVATCWNYINPRKIEK